MEMILIAYSYQNHSRASTRLSAPGEAISSGFFLHGHTAPISAYASYFVFIPPDSCSLPLWVEMKTFSRMKSFSLQLKISPIISRGGNSSATCNKDDLFARLGLQQEVSTHELLLHGLKINSQFLWLASLFEWRQGTFCTRKLFPIKLGANSNQVK